MNKAMKYLDDYIVASQNVSAKVYMTIGSVSGLGLSFLEKHGEGFLVTGINAAIGAIVGGLVMGIIKMLFDQSKKKKKE